MPNFETDIIPKISFVIISKNEAENIGECLDSIKDVANEIILVDSNSTDDTVEIAKSYGAKCYLKDWEGYGAAKNFGNSLAANPWIFSIDADERLDDTLKSSLKNMATDSACKYRIRRRNYIGDELIRFGEWNPDFKTRLFNRNISSWDTAPVHESLVHRKKLKAKVLKGNLLHFSHQDLNSYQIILTHYASLSVKNGNKNQSSLMLITWIKVIWRFVKGFIFKFGFLDGNLGFNIARMNARYILTRRKYVMEVKDRVIRE